ncbi:hypothetical protein CTEN210_10004 [Chaetoceros tenuissimus]|uniref:Uncharacterized protein n=1 Tax=Chaetoceros tenuissimus TaxID=426638 RepID=A0AAD3CWN2_9STRA|nr:hypothetical protein CTEN210_10004 [Chaetoceros tenuissimus]
MSVPNGTDSKNGQTILLNISTVYLWVLIVKLQRTSPPYTDETYNVLPNDSRQSNIHRKMNGSILLSLCCQKRWNEVRTYLQSDDIDKIQYISFHKGSGWNSLHKICGKSDTPLDILKLMVKIGGKDLILQSNLFGNTVLHISCWHDVSIDAIQCFVDTGGKDLIMLCNRHGNTALHEACRNSIGNDSVIKLLIDKAGPELLEIKNNEGKTAFSYLNQNKRSKLSLVDSIPQWCHS